MALYNGVFRNVVTGEEFVSAQCYGAEEWGPEWDGKTVKLVGLRLAAVILL